jgi:hypothetical protein
VSAELELRVLSIPYTVETAAAAECCDFPTASVRTPLLIDNAPPDTDPPPRLIVPLVLAVHPSPADIETPREAVVLIDEVVSTPSAPAS